MISLVDGTRNSKGKTWSVLFPPNGLGQELIDWHRRSPHGTFTQRPTSYLGSRTLDHLARAHAFPYAGYTLELLSVYLNPFYVYDKR